MAAKELRFNEEARRGLEAGVDKLADAVGLDPVEIRARNGFREGSTAPTGQIIDSAAPVEELERRLRERAT